MNFRSLMEGFAISDLYRYCAVQNKTLVETISVDGVRGFRFRSYDSEIHFVPFEQLRQWLTNLSP